MTCFTRCGDFCCPNNPRPIFTRSLGLCSPNTVVNPPIATTSFAFFTNNNVGIIASGDSIPLTITQSRDSDITQSLSVFGAVTLLPGIYQITYFVQGDIPTGGEISIGVHQNGVQLIDSVATQSGTTGTSVSISKTIVLNVNVTSTLQLINESGESVDFSTANMFISKL